MTATTPRIQNRIRRDSGIGSVAGSFTSASARSTRTVIGSVVTVPVSVSCDPSARSRSSV